MTIVRININTIGNAIRAAALVAATAVVPLGCAARLPEPSAADAVRAAKDWPGTTVSDLHRGKEQYAQRCSGCHGLVDPHRFEASRWPTFVKEMSGKLRLSDDELVDLTRYLVVAAASPTPTH
jgi:mono/diheme cytochrome c family protein